MALYFLTVILIVANVMPSKQAENLEHLNNIIDKLMEQTNPKGKNVSINNTEPFTESNIYYIQPFKDNETRYDGDGRSHLTSQSNSRRGIEDDIDNILDGIEKENGVLKAVLIEVEKKEPETNQSSKYSKKDEYNEMKAIQLLQELISRRPTKTDIETMSLDDDPTEELRSSSVAPESTDSLRQGNPLTNAMESIPARHRNIPTEPALLAPLVNYGHGHRPLITSMVTPPVVHGMLARQTLLGTHNYYPTISPFIHRIYVPYAQSKLQLVNNYPVYSGLMRPSPLNNFDRLHYINHMVNGAIAKLIYSRY